MDITDKVFDKWLKAAAWPQMENDEFPDTKYQYPYKHFLLLSIIEAYDGIPFDTKVDYRLISKNFYDLLTSDSFIVDAFERTKAKGNWRPGIWTLNLEKSVISLIKRMPAKMLSTYWSKKDNPLYEFRNGHIFFRNHSDLSDKELSNVIKEACIKRLKKCLPHNPSYNDEKNIRMLMNTKTYMKWLLNEMAEERIVPAEKGRNHQLQSLWRKALIDTRGCKCQVCEKPYEARNLQAAHIKKQSMCKSNKEKFDLMNGMMMCPDHHAFLDSGEWSVSNGKTVACKNIIDPCAIGENLHPALDGKVITTNKKALKYFEWHYKNIYRCK